MHDNGEPFHHFHTVIHSIRSILKMDWNVSLVHVFREANQCADYLAKSGVVGDINFVVLHDVSADMGLLLLADVLETPMMHC